MPPADQGNVNFLPWYIAIAVLAVGGTSQEGPVAAPWRKTFRGQPGQYLYVSAQVGGWGTEVTVNVYVGDRLVRTSTSRGAHTIASTDGRL
jgi:hypothetical protein